MLLAVGILGGLVGEEWTRYDGLLPTVQDKSILLRLR